MREIICDVVVNGGKKRFRLEADCIHRRRATRMLRHGRFTAEAVGRRREVAAMVREARRLIGNVK
jgi:hypothetical protein